jgi:transcriptional regulator GlxA family with amidase domain
MVKSIYSIALLAFEDGLPSTLFAFKDLMAFANEIAKYDKKIGIKVEIVSACGGTVTLAGGLSIQTKSANRCQYDALVVPGFMFTQKDGLLEYVQSFVKEIELLKRLHKNEVKIAGSCVGAFLLAEAGLLDSRKATTSWLFESRLQEYYPKVTVDARHILLKDKNILTTGAFSSIHDLAFHFITEHLGESVARKTQNLTLTPGVGDNQIKFVDTSFFTLSSSPFIETIHAWLIKKLNQRYSLDALALHMCMTPRTLMRRYKHKTNSTPLHYLQQQRVVRAKALLLTTDMNIDAIAESVGYQDTNAFRKVFCREVGERPVDFRRGLNRPARALHKKAPLKT